MDHLTHTQGLPLVGRLNEFSRILSKKESSLVLHKEINDVAMILNTLNTSTKQLGKKNSALITLLPHLASFLAFQNLTFSERSYFTSTCVSSLPLYNGNGLVNNS